MAVYIPPKMALPVSKGADLVIDFLQLVNDVYTDYAFNVTVTLEVDIQGTGRPTPPPVTVSAIGAISGYHAVCRIEWQVADTIKPGSLWRCVVSYPTIPESTEVVAINGTTTRYDGN